MHTKPVYDMCKSRGITLTTLSGIGTLRQTAAPSLRIAPDFYDSCCLWFFLETCLLLSGGVGRYVGLLLKFARTAFISRAAVLVEFVAFSGLMISFRTGLTLYRSTHLYEDSMAAMPTCTAYS